LPRLFSLSICVLAICAGCDSEKHVNDAALSMDDLTQPCGPATCSGCCGVSSGALICLPGTSSTSCGSGGADCISCSTSCVQQQCETTNDDLSAASGDLACARSTSPAILGACAGGCSGGYVCVTGACHKRCLTDCDCPTGTLCQAGPTSNYCQ
jgi:hypothetical protein